MIKENDFYTIEYTGSTEEGAIFDATDEKVAKDAGIYSKKNKYGPKIICIGQAQVLPGLDKSLIGKKTGDSYKVTLSAEEAFGKKQTELIKLLPVSRFKKEGIAIQPGIQVFVDGHIGIVKTVSGGRTLVDFNHPLASKKVHYQVKVGPAVTNTQKKLSSLLEKQIPDFNCVVHEKAATIQTKPAMPKEYAPIMEKQIKKLIPELDTINFEEKKD